MQPTPVGMLRNLKVKSHARVAALRHRAPSRHLQVIGVVGQDGSRLTIAYLAAMLRHAGHTVGVVAQDYIEIGEQRVAGSDQADVLSDTFRLQGLLAQMRKAGCSYVIIEIPALLPNHHFTALRFAMIVVRRCGDTYLDSATAAARAANIRSLLSLQPRFIVLNRDDPCFDTFAQATPGEPLMNFGTHARAECRLQHVRLHPKGSEIQLLIDHQTELTLTTTFTGKQAMYSLVAATAAAYLLHIEMSDIIKGTAQLTSLDNQLAFLPIPRPYSIVIDSSLTPEGVHEQLEVLHHFTKNRVIAVLSGHVAQAPHWRPLIGEIVAKAADRIIVTDGECTSQDSPQTIREQFLQGISLAGGEAMVDEIPDRQAALEKALSIARRGDIIVVISTTNRPYRIIGGERRAWSDRHELEELIG